MAEECGCAGTQQHDEQHTCTCGAPLACSAKMNLLTEKVDDLLTAFPNKDTDGHRAAHQKMIDAAIAQEKFWTELKLDLAKKGIIGLIIILLGLIAAGFSAKVAIALGIWKGTGGTPLG